MHWNFIDIATGVKPWNFLYLIQVCATHNRNTLSYSSSINNLPVKSFITYRIKPTTHDMRTEIKNKIRTGVPNILEYKWNK